MALITTTITLTAAGGASGPNYLVEYSLDGSTYTSSVNCNSASLATVGSSVTCSIDSLATVIRLTSLNIFCTNSVVEEGPITTTTTTQCACVEFITLNVTTSGSITWNDCYGNPEMVTASIGLETIGSFGEECVNINTLGGTAVYTIDSYGPCCVPPATTTTTAGPTTTTTAGPTTTTTAGPTTTTTTTTTAAPTTTTTTAAPCTLTIYFDVSQSPGTQGWNSSADACNGTGTPLTVYFSNTPNGCPTTFQDVFNDGKAIYTNAALTTVLAGNDKYYKSVQAPNSGISIQVGNDGFIDTLSGPC